MSFIRKTLGKAFLTVAVVLPQPRAPWRHGKFAARKKTWLRGKTLLQQLSESRRRNRSPFTAPAPPEETISALVCQSRGAFSQARALQADDAEDPSDTPAAVPQSQVVQAVNDTVPPATAPTANIGAIFCEIQTVRGNEPARSSGPETTGITDTALSQGLNIESETNPASAVSTPQKKHTIHNASNSIYADKEHGSDLIPLSGATDPEPTVPQQLGQTPHPSPPAEIFGGENNSQIYTGPESSASKTADESEESVAADAPLTGPLQSKHTLPPHSPQQRKNTKDIPARLVETSRVPEWSILEPNRKRGILIENKLPGISFESLASVELFSLHDNAGVRDGKELQSKPVYISNTHISSHDDGGGLAEYENEIPNEFVQEIPAANEPATLAIDFLGLLAHSSEGPVMLARQYRPDRVVVIKKVKGCREGPRVLPDEVRLLNELPRQHPNIVRLHHAFHDEQTPDYPWNIMLEYCDGGDMHQFFCHWADLGGRVPEMFLMHFMASMGRALGFLHCGLYYPDNIDWLSAPAKRLRAVDLHETPIIHRDIKLENIFLRWSPNNRYGLPDVVLGDFGCATRAHESRGLCGTQGYHSPEFLYAKGMADVRPDLFDIMDRGAPIMTAASDIYTFGVCVYKLLTFSDYVHGRSDIEMAVLASTVQDGTLIRTLQDCLRTAPADRIPSASLFYLAGVWEWQVARLFACGARMPRGSWPNSPTHDPA